jgi:hypothetical protein
MMAITAPRRILSASHFERRSGDAYVLQRRDDGSSGLGTAEMAAYM